MAKFIAQSTFPYVVQVVNHKERVACVEGTLFKVLFLLTRAEEVVIEIFTNKFKLSNIERNFEVQKKLLDFK